MIRIFQIVTTLLVVVLFGILLFYIGSLIDRRRNNPKISASYILIIGLPILVFLYTFIFIA